MDRVQPVSMCVCSMKMNAVCITSEELLHCYIFKMTEVKSNKKSCASMDDAAKNNMKYTKKFTSKFFEGKFTTFHLKSSEALFIVPELFTSICVLLYI